MAARRAVIGANPDETVDPAFGLGIAIGILALDQQRAALNPGLLPRVVIDQFNLVAMALSPA